MDKELRWLYIYMLKHKYIPIRQSCFWYRRKSSYYYYIDLKTHNDIGRISFYLRASDS